LSPSRTAPAIGLIHSGKRGTLANVIAATVAAMQRQFATRPANLRALIGSCIGPCHYDMHLWTAVKTQLKDTGIQDIHHPRLCTACHLDRYYSYRAEKAQTGRHFALLAHR
jgi:polyphenol oxidase